MTALLDALMERPLTEDDLDQVGQALRDTGIHYELDDGRLLLMSPMKSWHADVSRRVCDLLIAQGRVAYQEQGIRLARRKVRFPDVAAFRSHPDPDAGRHDPGEFTVVVEVVSSDSEHDDRVVKAELYASAGIPEYWIVDRHPGASRDAVIEFFKLGPGGQYQRAGDAVLSELEEKHGTR
ncbi:MAG: Uma2 family endonuclease [Natronosporangium sp.]